MESWISLRYISYQLKVRCTAPTSTTRPRSAQISTACWQGAADFAAAAMMTQSMPCPSVSALICSVSDTPPSRATSAPSRCASSTRCAFKSIANTDAPCNRANWAINWPTRPRPKTATFSPREMLAMRTLFRAMLPSVAKQACS